MTTLAPHLDDNPAVRPPLVLGAKDFHAVTEKVAGVVEPPRFLSTMLAISRTTTTPMTAPMIPPRSNTSVSPIPSRTVKIR